MCGADKLLPSPPDFELRMWQEMDEHAAISAELLPGPHSSALVTDSCNSCVL